jgi:hypothetical protein
MNTDIVVTLRQPDEFAEALGEILRDGAWILLPQAIKAEGTERLGSPRTCISPRKMVANVLFITGIF